MEYFRIKFQINLSVGTKNYEKKIIIYHECKIRTDKSVPQVIVWHHLAEPPEAKTLTLWTDLSVRITLMSDPHIHNRGQQSESIVSITVISGSKI